MDTKPPSLFRRILANIAATLTDPAASRSIWSGTFTPVTGPKPNRGQQQRNLAIQQAGQLPSWQDKAITPEQKFDTSLSPSPEPTAASVDRPGDPIRAPMKIQSEVTPQRVQQYLLAKFNPIRGLSPRLLSNYLEQWDLGFLRQMALVWSKIRERDDQVITSTESREVKPADMTWEIIATDESPDAAAHKEALEDFYNGLVCSHSLEINQRGGTAVMLKMMMKAVGDKFAPFEIIWLPDPATGKLTAELKYIPVWFFENRTGELRFLPYELALQGIPLEPGGWMVHVGKGLFAATSICYLYKQMGLKTWVTYQEKFGIPFLHAKTNADYNSDEWNGLASAIQNFGSDGGIVTKTMTEITPIIMGSQGEQPHEPFCDRMDRAIARIWRGGDLSSMSKGGGGGHSGGGGAVGALPQMQNETALAKTDAEQLSETVQFYLDRWVIRYKFGDGVQPLAKFQLQPPVEVDTEKEIAVDQFLLSCQVPLSISDLYERYGRNQPSEGDALATPPPQPGKGGFGSPGGDDSADPALANARRAAALLGNIAPGMKRFVTTSADLQAKALAKSLAPLKNKLDAVALIDDPARRRHELEAVRRSLPDYVSRGVSPELVKVIEQSLSTAVVIGATDAAFASGYRNRGGQAGGETVIHMHPAGPNGHDKTAVKYRVIRDEHGRTTHLEPVEATK